MEARQDQVAASLYELGQLQHITCTYDCLHACMFAFLCVCVCTRVRMHACMHAWRWMTQSNYLSQLQHLFLARQHPNIFTRNLSRSPRP